MPLEYPATKGRQLNSHKLCLTMPPMPLCHLCRWNTPNTKGSQLNSRKLCHPCLYATYASLPLE